MEEVQKTTVLRLDKVEKLLQDQQSQKRAWHPYREEYSQQPGSETFKDSDYWQTHYPFTQQQFTCMQQAQFASTQHQHTPPPHAQLSLLYLVPNQTGTPLSAAINLTSVLLLINLSSLHTSPALLREEQVRRKALQVVYQKHNLFVPSPTQFPYPPMKSTRMS